MNDFTYLRRRALWRAVPAAMAIVFVITAMTVSWFRSEAIWTKYRLEAFAAFQDNQLDKSAFLLSRVLNKPAPNPLDESQNRYLNAQILSAQGRTEEAIREVEALAPDDAAGFAPAHTVMAAWIAESNSQLDDELLKTLGHHVQNADPKDEGLVKAKVAYHIAMQEGEKAIAYMQGIAAENNRYLIALARVEKSLGEDAEANRHYQAGIKWLTTQVANRPDDIQLRGLLATALYETEQREKAIEVLEQGLKIGKTPELEAMVCDMEMEQMRMTPIEADPAATVQKLARLLQRFPNYPPIYFQIGSLYTNIQEPEVKQRLITEVQAMIVSGKDAPLAHMCLGNFYAIDGKNEQAIFHLEQACKLAPTLVMALNNLAWVLANQPEPDLDRAEMLVRRAVELAPNEIDFHETLGFILMKREKWREAIVEFELVMPVSKNTAKLHERLAMCYDALGMKDMAEMHRK